MNGEVSGIEKGTSNVSSSEVACASSQVVGGGDLSGDMSNEQQVPDFSNPFWKMSKKKLKRFFFFIVISF